MEGYDEANGDQLTSLSVVVVADEIIPSHKSIPLDETDHTSNVIRVTSY